MNHRHCHIICMVLSLFFVSYMMGFSNKGYLTYKNHKFNPKLIVIPYYLTIDYGSDKYREISFSSNWDYNQENSVTKSIPQFETQCGGVAYLLLKGRFKNLDIYIKCKNGKILVHESKVNVNVKKKVLIDRYRKDLFSGCEDKYDNEGHSYSVYDVFIEDHGTVLFHGEVIRRECYE